MSDASQEYTKTEEKARFSDKLTDMLWIVTSLENAGVKIIRCDVDHDAKASIMVGSSEDLDGWALGVFDMHTEMVPFADGQYPDTPYQRQIMVPETNVLVFQLVRKEAE